MRGWPGFAGVEPEAAAGARGFAGPALRCTGGRVVRCFGFLRLRWARWWARERAAVAVATATPWPAARCFGHGWGSGLELAKDDEERGNRVKGSPRSYRDG